MSNAEYTCMAESYDASEASRERAERLQAHSDEQPTAAQRLNLRMFTTPAAEAAWLEFLASSEHESEIERARRQRTPQRKQ